MKRILSFALVLLMLVLSLASCQGGGGTKKPSKTVYDTVNEMAQKNYSSIILNVSSTLNGETLTDNYTIMQIGDDTIVDYSCKRRSTFEDGQLPESYYATYTGRLILRDGKIISQDGENVSIDFTAFDVKNLSFKEDYFSDVTEESGQFSANVSDPAGFFGENVNISGVSISLEYASAFSALEIHYTATNGAKVVINYQFM